jgi:hypothetical protein
VKTPAARCRFQTHIDERLGGDFTVDLAWLLANPLVVERFELTLPAGTVTLSVPPGVQFIGLVPPVSNTATIVLKGNAADDGIPLHPAFPTIISNADSVTAIVLTLSADIPNFVIVYL